MYSLEKLNHFIFLAYCTDLHVCDIVVLNFDKVITGLKCLDTKFEYPFYHHSTLSIYVAFSVEVPFCFFDIWEVL